MQMSSNTGSIFPALIKARADIEAVPRTKEGYGYKYVTLDDILNMLKAVLPKYGLGFVQFPESVEGKDGLTTLVFHDSGEFISARYEMDATPVKGTNVTQQKGASITYCRRYALASIFGIASEEDTDGRVEGDRFEPMTVEQRSRLLELNTDLEGLMKHFQVGSLSEISKQMAAVAIKAKEAKLVREQNGANN